MKKITVQPNSSKIIFQTVIGHTDTEYSIREHASAHIILIGREPSESIIAVRLMGEYASARITGAFSLAQRESVFIQTIQTHEAPNTSSDLCIKCVIDDSADFIYKGTIRINRDAGKSDAYQRNDVLTLSEDASVDSQPILEIKNNDVRCTHGVSIGPLRDEELWYMSTRGIRRDVAKKILSRGFLDALKERGENFHEQKKITEEIEKYLI